MRFQVSFQRLARINQRIPHQRRGAGGGGHAGKLFGLGVHAHFHNRRVDARFVAHGLQRDGVHALTHLRPAVIDKHFVCRRNRNQRRRFIGHPVADAGVFDAARNPCVFGIVKFVFDGFQRGARPAAAFNHLPGGGHVAVLQRVVVAELPAVKAALFAQIVNQALQPKRGLVHAKAAHRAAGDVVGVNGRCFHIRNWEMVHACGVSRRPFQHLHTHRRIRARIADKLHLHKRQLAVFVAANLVIHPNWMPLRMHHDRFIPRQPNFGWFVEQMGHHGYMALHGQIFFAAKAAAVRHQHDSHLVFGNVEQFANLDTVVVNALSLRVKDESVGGGGGNGRFRFHKPVLDPLCLKHTRGCKCRICFTCRHITPIRDRF